MTAARLEDARRAPRVGTAALTTEAEKVRADMVLCVCGNESKARPAPFFRALELAWNRSSEERLVEELSGKSLLVSQEQCPYERKIISADEAR